MQAAPHSLISGLPAVPHASFSVHLSWQDPHLAHSRAPTGTAKNMTSFPAHPSFASSEEQRDVDVDPSTHPGAPPPPSPKLLFLADPHLNLATLVVQDTSWAAELCGLGFSRRSVPRPAGSAAFHPFLAEMLPAHKSPLCPQPLTPSGHPKLGCCPALWCSLSGAGASSHPHHVAHGPPHLCRQPWEKQQVGALHTVFIVHSLTNVQNKSQTIKGETSEQELLMSTLFSSPWSPACSG